MPALPEPDADLAPLAPMNEPTDVTAVITVEPPVIGAVAPVDSAFVTGATQSSNAEIGAAKIALAKSQNTEIIAFANEMISQHTQEKTALAPIAASVDLGLPTNVSPTQAATAAQLQATREPAFDALYSNNKIQGHTLNIDNNYNPQIASERTPRRRLCEKVSTTNPDASVNGADYKDEVRLLGRVD